MKIFDKSLLTVTTSFGSVNLISLTLPTLGETIFINLLGTVNTIVLGGYSEEAVAATGVVNVLFTLLVGVLSCISTGTITVISNFIGMDRLDRAQKVCWSSVIFGGLVSMIFTFLIILAGPLIVRWMNLTGVVYDMALIYLRIRVCALVFQMVSTILLAQLRCYGYPKYVVLVGMITNVCNLLFSIYAVNYAKHPYFSDVNGVALGTVLSQLIGLIIVIAIVCKVKIRYRITESIQEFGQLVKNILKIGGPVCFSDLGYSLSQVITNSFAVLLGIHAVSGKMYFSNIYTYSNLFSGAIGTSMTILIGMLYGAGRFEHAERLVRMIVRVTIPLNLFMSVSIWLLREPILSLFTDNEAIIEMAFAVLAVDIIAEMARAFSHIYERSLQGTEDVTFTSMIIFISCWVCGVGLGYFLSITCNLGLVGIWIGFAADESVRAIVTYFRWRSGKWKKEQLA